MYYEISGGTKRERKLVEDAVLFAKKYLMPRIRDLDIEITITKKMEVDADVVGDEREYEMRIRGGQDEEDLITSVFHEMVHVKQGVRKEFPLFEDCDMEYLDRPWEKEAYDLQEKILDAYKKI